MEKFEVIKTIVCLGERVNPELLPFKTRKREIVFARQVIMYLMKENTKDSLAKIGRNFGKDHATVLHSIKTVNNLIDTDPTVSIAIKIYQSKIKELYDFESNVYIDRIQQLTEIIRLALSGGMPIDIQQVALYNSLVTKKGLDG